MPRRRLMAQNRSETLAIFMSSKGTLERKIAAIRCFSSPAESKLLESEVRVGSRVSLEVNGQALKTPKIDARRAFERLDVDVQVGKSASDFGEGHLRFESSQRGSEAGVNPMAEGHEPCTGTAKIKRVRIRKASVIAICRTQKQRDALSLRDDLATDRDVFNRFAYSGLYRSVKAQELAYRRRCDCRIARK